QRPPLDRAVQSGSPASYIRAPTPTTTDHGDTTDGSERPLSIDGKTALVTGGSRGIGLMIAQGFVEAGAKVYISSRKAEVCDEVAAELSKIGTCIALPANLSTEEECRRLAGELGEREERLDILVNNAGANWG